MTPDKPLTEEQKSRMRKYSREYRKKGGSSRNITIYLGKGEERETRLAALDRLAATFGFTDNSGKPLRSHLIQAICDDKLVIKAKAPQR